MRVNGMGGLTGNRKALMAANGLTIFIFKKKYLLGDLQIYSYTSEKKGRRGFLASV